ncbi:hypothetical protein AVEN_98426-1 [Araneus ventricosus]|uniref:Uncharacterized protein n=1 Tax=Araneus ventricosus TaxID=182803 RepID=A0A4Y2WG78_ARAVE|nr:hypothetical protein AVEN_98426-1 [Araneus ventricosus]
MAETGDDNKKKKLIALVNCPDHAVMGYDEVLSLVHNVEAYDRCHKGCKFSKENRILPLVEGRTLALSPGSMAFKYWISESITSLLILVEVDCLTAKLQDSPPPPVCTRDGKAENRTRLPDRVVVDDTGDD